MSTPSGPPRLDELDSQNRALQALLTGTVVPAAVATGPSSSGAEALARNEGQSSQTIRLRLGRCIVLALQGRIEQQLRDILLTFPSSEHISFSLEPALAAAKPVLEIEVAGVFQQARLVLLTRVGRDYLLLLTPIKGTKATGKEC